MRDLVFVIDMINGFVKKGALADANIAKITPEIEKIIKNSTCVHFICDNHDESDLEMRSYPLHCIAGSSESKIIDELKIYANDANTTLKKSTNGFINLDKEILNNYDRFILTGCCTDICVLQFGLSLRAYLNEKNIDKDILLIKQAVDTYDAPNHNRDYYNESAINLMRNAGIKII